MGIKRYDIVIVGAGPAGLSAAYTAKKRGLDYLAIERGSVADTVRNFPLGKPLFSTSNELEFTPGSLHASHEKPTREEVLDYYERFAEKEEQLRIHTNETVEKILPGAPLEVFTDRDRYRARAVLVAVGGVGRVNRLDGPRGTPPRGSFFFFAAAPLFANGVLVVGGGNSAAEAALYLAEAGARVAYALRRPSFDLVEGSKGSAIKPWVRRPLEEAVAAGKIRLFFSAGVVSIEPQTVVIESNSEHYEIKCDHVFAITVARPDVSLLEAAGVSISADGRPNYDPETFETNIENLFVAGHLTRELHMKQAVKVPPKIVDYIADCRLRIA